MLQNFPSAAVGGECYARQGIVPSGEGACCLLWPPWLGAQVPCHVPSTQPLESVLAKGGGGGSVGGPHMDSTSLRLEQHLGVVGAQ